MTVGCVFGVLCCGFFPETVFPKRLRLETKFLCRRRFRQPFTSPSPHKSRNHFQRLVLLQQSVRLNYSFRCCHVGTNPIPQPFASFKLNRLEQRAMTHSCCFDVLGIAPGASETEIKKAFRRKAVRVHPDKVPQDRKEEANRAFRELHEAYEEAIEHSHNRGAYPAYSDFSSPKKPSPSKGKRNKRASDSDIKKKFNDICEELKRESSTSWNESLLEYTRQARAA